MTVDWDEELRKLNAAQYTKKRAERAKKEAEPDVMKWAKTNTRKAQSAAQETSFKVMTAQTHPKFAKRTLHSHPSFPIPYSPHELATSPFK